MGCALQFRNVTLGYDRHPAVHHLDGEVASGALIAVVGPNGAGKSTLFKGVVGLLKPLAGRIERDAVAPQDIAYLPQAAEIDRSFPVNVYDLVAMGLWRHTGGFGGVGREARSRLGHWMWNLNRSSGSRVCGAGRPSSASRHGYDTHQPSPSILVRDFKRCFAPRLMDAAVAAGKPFGRRERV
jgi:energy-coupling factor transporter ATP-binding protein EcfA2